MTKEKVKIPTAEEFLMNRVYVTTDGVEDVHDSLQSVKDALIEFAKLHVQAALKAADEQASVTAVDHEEISEGSFKPVWGVDSNSILNAYPLNNIE